MKFIYVEVSSQRAAGKIENRLCHPKLPRPLRIPWATHHYRTVSTAVRKGHEIEPRLVPSYQDQPPTTTTTTKKERITSPPPYLSGDHPRPRGVRDTLPAQPLKPRSPHLGSYDGKRFRTQPQFAANTTLAEKQQSIAGCLQPLRADHAAYADATRHHSLTKIWA